jgi:hypothetical protein
MESVIPSWAEISGCGSTVYRVASPRSEIAVPKPKRFNTKRGVLAVFIFTSGEDYLTKGRKTSGVFLDLFPTCPL